MTQIALETFITFRELEAGSFIFSPAPRAVNNENGAINVVLSDIPFPSGVPSPRNSLTVVYGYKDAVEEMQKQYALAKSTGMNLVAVSVGFDIGHQQVGVTSLSELPNILFLNVKRCSSEVQGILLDGVNELAANEGGEVSLFDKASQLGNRPDLLCDFVRTDSRFSHIAAVCYQFPSESPRGRQVVTILANNVVSVSTRGVCPFEVQLPIDALLPPRGLGTLKVA